MANDLKEEALEEEAVIDSKEESAEVINAEKEEVKEEEAVPDHKEEEAVPDP